MKPNIRIKGYILCMVMVLCTVLLAGFSAKAEGKPFEGFEVAYTLANGFEYKVKTFIKYYPEKEDAEQSEDGEKTITESERVAEITREHALVLPYGVQNRPVTLIVPEGCQLAIDGTQYADNSQMIIAEGTHTVLWNGEQYTLYVMYTSNIPQVYITVAEDAMEKVHADKDYREAGTITITDGNITEHSGNLEYIKGRGNATWVADKKPYNIKLEKNSNLFDMGISKKYSLMANATDDTIIKNKIGMDFAEKLGIEYNMQSQYVDLFINNEYIGNYLLTERVEVDTYRVNITDLESINEAANPDIDLDTLESAGETEGGAYAKKGSYKWVELPYELSGTLNGGYLLEFELGWRYDGERCGFVSDYGQPIVLQGPENASQKQVEYIKNYYCEFEQAVLSDDGYNSQGRHYSDYIDMESFAKMYLIQEFAQNLDAATTSFYLYKDIGGKLTACTVWDLDMAFGKKIERNGYNIAKTDNIWAMDNIVMKDEQSEIKTIFTLLCQHSDFRNEIVEQWETCFKPNISYMISQTDALYGTINSSAVADRYKWNVTAPTPQVATDDYYVYIDALKIYINYREEFLSGCFRSGDSYLQYSANGGEGIMIEKSGFAQSENAVAKENLFTNGQAKFIGWNTEKDGSGTACMPGDTVDMSQGDTVLYAQWDGAADSDDRSDAVSAQSQQSDGIFYLIINWFKNLIN